MRRFYKSVEIATGPNGHQVTLDGKPIRTPAGRPFLVLAAALARAIAGEWASAPPEGEIKPLQMPMTRLAMTALDRVADQREKVVSDIAAYGGSDLLCYRAEGPAELVARQASAWDPLLHWARTEHGIDLAVTAGVMPVPQPDEVLTQVRVVVERCDDFELSGLFQLAAGYGSVILALAVLDGRISAQQGCDLAEIDAAWQAERWGEDVEAGRQRARVRADMLAAGSFLANLRATD